MGFAGIGNIKRCARMVGDLSDNFCAVSPIGGALFRRLRHKCATPKKEDYSHEKTPHRAKSCVSK